MRIITIGIDRAKNIFAVHRVNENGHVNEGGGDVVRFVDAGENEPDGGGVSRTELRITSKVHHRLHGKLALFIFIRLRRAL